MQSREHLSPLDAVGRARSATTTLLEPERYAATVETIGLELERHPWSRGVWGASEVGQALAGAIADRYSATIRLWVPGTTGPVLLLDGVIAHLAGLSLAALRARQRGATSIEAIFLGFVGTPSTVGHIDRMVDLHLDLATADVSLHKAA